ncbi:WXG100 family type VII secretion target [Streptomyces sp. NPDC005648]|uniref:WXG100 family type VII secretion target n=1 Tax=Streptomyces sp. NPDC005648 TaxID=3157044 RepID=UPI0033BF7BD0
MPGQLTVRFETLAQATEDIGSIADALQEHLTQLDGAVSRIAETWEGDAHDAFGDYCRRWQSASHDLHRTLRRLQKIVETAHGNYAGARTANVRMWRGR